MIRSLEGEIYHHEGQSMIVKTNSGVGYLVYTTSRTGLETEGNIHLFTHLAVRETALDLYGFPLYRELELFELLLTIPKIGPKSALAIMEVASFELIIECIRAGDAGRLTKMSGVGKKTAEKVVAELAEKLPPHFVTHDANENIPQAYQDAFDTLVTLGYAPGDVRQTLETIDTNLSTSEIVKLALKQLH